MIRKVAAVLLVALGLFLLVSAVATTYGVLETYADPQRGLLANLEVFIAPLALAALLGLAALAGGIRLVASPRVTVIVLVVALVGTVGGCWIGGELGIDAKERELSGVVR